MAVVNDLAEIAVSQVDLSRFVRVDRTKTVTETVDAMRDAGYSSALVTEDDELVGIFTQRDVVTRVLGRSRVCDLPISDEMTRSVRTMKSDQSVADGLAIMIDWWVRSVPVVDDSGHLQGNLSWYTVMETMAGLLKRPIPEQGEAGLQEGLAFVDFTGLNTNSPVMVAEDDTAEVAVHHMRARAIGSVLVVDQRGRLSGILTEFDLLVHLACTGVDLDAVTVGDLMTSEVVSLSARSSIADAIQQMAARGFSHAPLLGESSRPVAIASFREIAAYIETNQDSIV